MSGFYLEETLLFNDPRATMPKTLPSFSTAFENKYMGLAPGQRDNLYQSQPTQPIPKAQSGGMFLPDGFDQPIQQTAFGPRIWRK
jgi:hypothetical protein